MHRLLFKHVHALTLAILIFLSVGVGFSAHAQDTPKGFSINPISEYALVVKRIFKMINAGILEHLTISSDYKSWSIIDKEATAKAESTMPIEELGRFSWSCATKTQMLTDGPASFVERNKLIENATTSIHILSWAFYDDFTGWEAAQSLVAKAEKGVSVKIIVDGQTAEENGFNETLDYMVSHGIPVIRWYSAGLTHPCHGMHRKIFIVDGKTMITGGLNFGDFYSHKGRVADGLIAGWRDQDILVEGPVVIDAENLFATIWNDKIESDKLPGSLLPIAPRPVNACASTDARVALVDHAPTVNAEDPIYLITLRMILSAKTSLDISNAYIILTPAFEKALLGAIERGVRVRIFTNSSDSIDEPIVTAPILESVKLLAKAGATIYLKQGKLATMHSKFMMVDGLQAWVGSYNLHPRSYRFESENILYFEDSAMIAELETIFENDLTTATLLSDPDNMKIPSSLSSYLAKFFFDQL